MSASARDEADLGMLNGEARRLLTDDRQGVLDLGITPVAAKGPNGAAAAANQGPLR